MAVYFDDSWKVWRYRTVVKLRDGRTKVRISGTPEISTKDEATRAERDHIARSLDPPEAPPVIETVETFAGYAKEWLKRYPAANGNRPSVLAEKQRIVDLHLKPVLGALPLNDVKGEVLSTLFAELKSQKSAGRPKPVAAQTKRNVKMVLRRILASAVEEGKLAAIPVLPKVKVPKIADSKKWDWLRSDESAQLLAAARDEHERVLFMFAMHVGARLGEQLAIRWSDIDLRARNITIRRAMVRGVVLPPKSGHGREVPMTEGLAAALKKMKHDRGELVFCDTPGRPLPYDSLGWRLDKALKRAQLRRIRWHDLRHTFCSQLVSAGVPLRQIQEWAGHSSIVVTERYAHLAPGAGKALIAALDVPAAPRLRAV